MNIEGSGGGGARRVVVDLESGEAVADPRRGLVAFTFDLTEEAVDDEVSRDLLALAIGRAILASVSFGAPARGEARGGIEAIRRLLAIAEREAIACDGTEEGLRADGRREALAGVLSIFADGEALAVEP